MNFNHDEVLWILHNYQTLRQGIMPARREESLRHVFSYHAPFEHACQLAAEVAIRVQRCGLDGLLVEERFGMLGEKPSQTEWQLSQQRHLPVDEVRSRVNKVTWYISGPNIPEVSYDDWKRENKFRQVLRINVGTTAVMVTAS